MTKVKIFHALHGDEKTGDANIRGHNAWPEGPPVQQLITQSKIQQYFEKNYHCPQILTIILRQETTHKTALSLITFTE